MLITQTQCHFIKNHSLSEVISRLFEHLVHTGLNANSDLYQNNKILEIEDIIYFLNKINTYCDCGSI